MQSANWKPSGQHASVHFTVTADASAGLLPSIMMPLAKRDITPDTFSSVRDGEVVRVSFSVEAMPVEMVALVEGNLRQIIGVHAVFRRQEITGSVRRLA